jgi:hypothetical protein
MLLTVSTSGYEIHLTDNPPEGSVRAYPLSLNKGQTDSKPAYRQARRQTEMQRLSSRIIMSNSPYFSLVNHQEF